MVKVYLRKEEYGKALKLSKLNFEKRPENIYYINDYFTSLIKQSFHSPEELDVLQGLLARAQKSLNKKADEFYSAMTGEYIYYIRGDVDAAIEYLLDVLRLNRKSYHTYKTLYEIYKREGRDIDMMDLEGEYPEHRRAVGD